MSSTGDQSSSVNAASTDWHALETDCGFQITLFDETQTWDVARSLAVGLCRGDWIGLRGPLGSGKTSFSRAMIRCLLHDPSATVASPTFSLVQSYHTVFGHLLHADLYRLKSAGEADSLDLEDSSGEHITVVEWSELGDFRRVDDDLIISFHVVPENETARIIDFKTSSGWRRRLKRLWLRRQWIGRCGWDSALREPLTGDASPRAFERLTADGQEPVILMDAAPRPDCPLAPPEQERLRAMARIEPSDIVSVVAVNQTLRNSGLPAAKVLASDSCEKFVLFEDFGSDGIVSKDSRPLGDRFHKAMEVLAELHQCQFPKIWSGSAGTHRIPSWTLEVAERELDVFLAKGMGALDPEIEPLPQEAELEFRVLWRSLLEPILSGEPVCMLLDFHSPNILWREKEGSSGEIGLIDTQNALWGPAAYDVVSLAQDARILISRALERDLREHYLRTSNRASDRQEPFLRDYAVLGTQRALRLLGQFVRLAEVDGKDQYLRYLNPQRDYLLRNLNHPALKGFGDWLCRYAPHLLIAPDPKDLPDE